MEEIVVGGLKLFLFKKRNETPKLVLCILQHLSFINESPSDYFTQCSKLSERLDNGVVICMEQRNHGSRLLSRTQNESWTEGNWNHATDMWIIQYGTAKDISFLIDTLPAAMELDNVCWGVAGVSLGGHSTLLAMANDARLSFGISVIGCGDYLALMKHRYQITQPRMKTFPSFRELIPDKLIGVLQKFDPVNNIESFCGKKVLMISGELDNVVPNSASAAFLAQLEVKHGSLSVTNIVEPHVKHQFTDEMLDRVIEWLQQIVDRA